MFCNKCGAQIPDDSEFCHVCGKKIGESTAAQPTTTQSTTNNLPLKIIGVVVLICLLLALLGVFDGIGEKIGEAEIFKGNDTKSAFSDTTGGKPSTRSISMELMDYVNKTENDVIEIFGFKENESHIYPSIGTEENNYQDYCFMFMFEDGNVYDIAINEKTYALYPEASIYGVKYDMSRVETEKKLSEVNYKYLTELEVNGEIRAVYYGPDYRTIVVTYIDGKAKHVEYSSDDMTEIINSELALHDNSKESDYSDNTINLEDQSSNSGTINYEELMYTIVMYYANYYGTNNVAAEIDYEDEDTVTIRLYDPYTTTTSNTLGFFIYNKKTGVWTDGIFGEPVDFNASVDSYNEVQETITEYYYAYVNAPDGYVNLRTGPGTEYDIICPIPNGEALELCNEEAIASNGKKWIKVAYYVDGGWNTGWVIASQIEYEKYGAGSSYLYDEYILPYSSEVELTEADLMWLSAQELTYARNEIYARHGYIFKSNELNEYFGSKSWYYPNPEFDGTLYGIELSNVNFIREYQEKYGLQYKPN